MTLPLDPRRKKTVSECTGLMLALLACYKSHNFVKGKCNGEEQALTDCTLKKVSLLLLPHPLLFKMAQRLGEHSMEHAFGHRF